MAQTLSCAGDTCECKTAERHQNDRSNRVSLPTKCELHRHLTIAFDESGDFQYE